MEAQIVDLKQWKAAHPPAIVCLNAALAMGLAWGASPRKGARQQGRFVILS